MNKQKQNWRMMMNNVDKAVAYYTAIADKNVEKIDAYLHPDVEFIGPMANMQGKEAVLAAAKGFANFVQKLTVRAKFEAGDQVMLAYDLDCPAPIGNFRAATLMTFKDGFISKLELFYDALPFEKHKDEIFS